MDRITKMHFSYFDGELWPGQLPWFNKLYFHKVWIFEKYIFELEAFLHIFNPLNANFKKWSNTLKQFVGKLATNCLSVFDHFMKLALKELKSILFQKIIQAV